VTDQVTAADFLAEFAISIVELGGNPLDVAPPTLEEMDQRLVGGRCGCGRVPGCRLAEAVAV
jgi:hypothetical protein